MAATLMDLAGVYVRFGETLDPVVSRRIHALARAVLAEGPDGVTDVVPGYTSLYVEHDPERIGTRRLLDWIERQDVDADDAPSRQVEVPVRYDGPDLQDISAHAGIEPAEVARLHAAPTYHVYAVGFTPGYPFMGEVDPAIRMPRLPTPRARVEAHSVAIADGQTGIYPLPSPGGWRVLGTALDAVYDPHRDPPFLLEPGDAVRFVRAEGDTPPLPPPLNLLPAEPRHPTFRVQEPGVLDLVVDRGRFRAGRFGLARSGPLDARSARLANALVANDPDSPLLEMNLRGPVLEASRDVVVAFAGWGMQPTVNDLPVEPFASRLVRAGDRLTFPSKPPGVRGYLAVAGGIESGTFFASASVDVRGLIGRPLAAGDVLGTAGLRNPRTPFSFWPHARFGASTTLRVEPGPQPDPAALTALQRGSFRVLQADRMGIRFGGADVPGGTVTSEATPLGAIQITPGGQPLLLLHDRGTIGGYVKPAIVRAADLPLAGQLRPGDRVRFVVEEA